MAGADEHGNEHIYIYIYNCYRQRNNTLLFIYIARPTCFDLTNKTYARPWLKLTTKYNIVNFNNDPSSRNMGLSL
jgi:hypothetical protein